VRNKNIAVVSANGRRQPGFRFANSAEIDGVNSGRWRFSLGLCVNVVTHFLTEGPDFMARPGPETQAKRRREQDKIEKRRAKAEKKALRKAQKQAETEVPSSEESPPESE